MSNIFYLRSDLISQLMRQGDGQLKQEFSPLFNFHLFPKLKALKIVMREDCSLAMNPESFKHLSALKSLEHFSLNMSVRLVGNRYVFPALLNLPLLASFELSMPFIREEDHRNLTECFKKQINLKYLSLAITSERSKKNGYSIQNNIIENVYQYMENKPNLQYVSLSFPNSPIQCLSKGFAKMSMICKLEDLKIEATDDFLISKDSPAEQVKGICDLIRSQKESLRSLELVIDTMLEKDLGTIIMETLSELENLTRLELHFSILSPSEAKDSYYPFFRKFYKNKKVTKKNKGIKVNDDLKEINTLLQKMLKGLKNLAACSILVMYDKGLVDLEDLTKILHICSGLKALRTLDLILPLTKMIDKIDSQFDGILAGMSHLMHVGVTSSSSYSSKSMEFSLKKVNRRQCSRSDFMF